MTLSPGDAAYLQTWMDRVSRSFAVVVACLEAPLNSYMSAAYLICRVIDNIEDSKATKAWKRLRFAEVAQLLEKPSIAGAILPDWDAQVWSGINGEQRQIMTSLNTSQLWQLYDLFPAEVKSIIRTWSLRMVEGMSLLDEAGFLTRKAARDDVQILATQQDYDQYCYTVAGTVGYMATELVILQYGLGGEVSQALLGYCEPCGRGLQKTNIVKDFTDDLERGVCFLPDEWLREVEYAPLVLKGAAPNWIRKVLDNVLSELSLAVEYTLRLPYEVGDYRFASLLCLLPAYQTIYLAARQKEDLFTAGHPKKISRETFERCIRDAQSMVTNNAAIRQYSQELNSAIAREFSGV
jgi:farnesyl-diphosphate farnesyltransferase